MLLTTSRHTLRSILHSPHYQSPLLTRLASTLTILEHTNGTLTPASLSAITAARALNSPVTGFIAGSNIKQLALEVSKIEGLDKVISVDNAAYDRGLPETYAPLIVENIRKGGFTHVFAPSSAFGKNVMPRVAAALDVMQVSDVTEVKSEDSMYFPNLPFFV